MLKRQVHINGDWTGGYSGIIATDLVETRLRVGQESLESRCISLPVITPYLHHPPTPTPLQKFFFFFLVYYMYNPEHSWSFMNSNLTRTGSNFMTFILIKFVFLGCLYMTEYKTERLRTTKNVLNAQLTKVVLAKKCHHKISNPQNISRSQISNPKQVFLLSCHSINIVHVSVYPSCRGCGPGLIFAFFSLFPFCLGTVLDLRVLIANNFISLFSFPCYCW